MAGQATNTGLEDLLGLNRVWVRGRSLSLNTTSSVLFARWNSLALCSVLAPSQHLKSKPGAGMNCSSLQTYFLEGEGVFTVIPSASSSKK